ncbi:Nodulation protein N [Sulfitobacter sp. SK012]|uniref:MaoC family dehydratase n=1 Tax=Sulfitobacter sp. SK012 TaxID=1389005 RepID=UPI000E0AC7C7|nr:Nodulation protein N [Sulfitobacter sp. SK012]
MLVITRAHLLEAVGTELGCSEWFAVEQARIDAFAEVTEDRQFIHIDPERAAHTVFGGTVAHGLLTLSMMSGLAEGTLPDIEGQSASINYGFDKVRFVTPVHNGARIRGRYVLRKAEMRAGGDKLMTTFDAVVEIEGVERPALTAVWMILYAF